MDSGGESCDSLARSLTSPSSSSLGNCHLQVEAPSSLLEVLQLNRCHNQESSHGKNELPEKNPLNNTTEEFSSFCSFGEQGSVSHNLNDTSASVELKDVWKCGYLRMLKPSKKRFFVLRGPSNTGPSRLEYYDNEKKFKYGMKSFCTPNRVRGSPKNIIYLHQCFTVSKRADSKHRHLIALYTKHKYFAMVAESEEDQEDWCEALNVLMTEEKKDHRDTDELDDGYWTMSPGIIFKEVWHVIVKPKGLGQSKNLTGLWRLCLSTKAICLVKMSSDIPSVNLPLWNVRGCGHSESFFFLELGRSSSTGPGEIWMQVDSGDPLVAQKMHETILEAMKALRTIPNFRPRSISQSCQSNPFSVIHARRHHRGILPPSQTGLQYSSRSRTVGGQLSPKRIKGNEGGTVSQISIRFDGTINQQNRSGISSVALCDTPVNTGLEESLRECACTFTTSPDMLPCTSTTSPGMLPCTSTTSPGMLPCTFTTSPDMLPCTSTTSPGMVPCTSTTSPDMVPITSTTSPDMLPCTSTTSPGIVPCTSTTSPDMVPITSTTSPDMLPCTSTTSPGMVPCTSTTSPDMVPITSTTSPDMLPCTFTTSPDMLPCTSTTSPGMVPCTSTTSPDMVPITSTTSPDMLPCTSTTSPGMVPCTSTTSPGIVPCTSTTSPDMVPITSTTSPDMLPCTSTTSPGMVPCTTNTSPGIVPCTSTTSPGMVPSTSTTSPGMVPCTSTTSPGMVPCSSTTSPGMVPSSSTTSVGMVPCTSTTSPGMVPCSSATRVGMVPCSSTTSPGMVPCTSTTSPGMVPCSSTTSPGMVPSSSTTSVGMVPCTSTTSPGMVPCSSTTSVAMVPCSSTTSPGMVPCTSTTSPNSGSLCFDKHPWYPGTSDSACSSDRGSFISDLGSEVCTFQESSNTTPDTLWNYTHLEGNSMADYVVMDSSVTAVARTHEEQSYTMNKSFSEYENPLSSNTQFLNLYGQSKVAFKDGYMSMTPGLVPDEEDIASEFSVPPTYPGTPVAAALPQNQACSQDYMFMLSASRSPANDSRCDVECSQSDEYVDMSLKSYSSSCAPLSFNRTCFLTNREHGDDAPVCHPVDHPCSDVVWNSRQPLCSSPCRTSRSDSNVGLNVSNVSVLSLTGVSLELQGLWDERDSPTQTEHTTIPTGHLNDVSLDVRQGQYATTVNTDNTSSSLPRHISPGCPGFYTGIELPEPAGQNTTTRHWLYLCLPFCTSTDSSE